MSLASGWSAWHVFVVSSWVSAGDGSGGRATPGSGGAAATSAGAAGNSRGGGGGSGSGGSGGASLCECGDEDEYPPRCALAPKDFCLVGYLGPVEDLTCPLTADQLRRAAWVCEESGPASYAECDNGTTRFDWQGNDTSYSLIFDAGGALVYARADGFVAATCPGDAVDVLTVTAGSATADVSCGYCFLAGCSSGEAEGAAGGGGRGDTCIVGSDGRIALP